MQITQFNFTRHLTSCGKRVRRSLSRETKNCMEQINLLQVLCYFYYFLNRGNKRRILWETGRWHRWWSARLVTQRSWFRIPGLVWLVRIVNSLKKLNYLKLNDNCDITRLSVYWSSFIYLFCNRPLITWRSFIYLLNDLVIKMALHPPYCIKTFPSKL